MRSVSERVVRKYEDPDFNTVCPKEDCPWERQQHVRLSSDQLDHGHMQPFSNGPTRFRVMCHHIDCTTSLTTEPVEDVGL